MSIRKTRFAELGYEQHAPGLWRIMSLDTPAAVGPHYASKAELLADLERYATFYGCNGPSRIIDMLARNELRGFIETEVKKGTSDQDIAAAVKSYGFSDENLVQLIREAIQGIR
jgi:hypothetical protein